jgi:hypothetical protein
MGVERIALVLDMVKVQKVEDEIDQVARAAFGQDVLECGESAIRGAWRRRRLTMIRT